MRRFGWLIGMASMLMLCDGCRKDAPTAPPVKPADTTHTHDTTQVRDTANVHDPGSMKDSGAVYFSSLIAPGYATAVTVDANGRILVGAAPDLLFILARNGTLVRKAQIPSFNSIVCILPTGNRIAVNGVSSQDWYQTATSALLDENGNLLQIDKVAPYSSYRSGLLLPDGGWYAVGTYAASAPHPGPPTSLLYRYNANGTRNASLSGQWVSIYYPRSIVRSGDGTFYDVMAVPDSTTHWGAIIRYVMKLRTFNEGISAGTIVKYGRPEVSYEARAVLIDGALWLLGTETRIDGSAPPVTTLAQPLPDGTLGWTEQIDDTDGELMHAAHRELLFMRNITTPTTGVQLTKRTLSGQMIWRRLLHPCPDATAKGLVVTPDGDIIVVGSGTLNGRESVWVMRTDKDALK